MQVMQVITRYKIKRPRHKQTWGNSKESPPKRGRGCTNQEYNVGGTNYEYKVGVYLTRVHVENSHNNNTSCKSIKD